MAFAVNEFDEGLGHFDLLARLIWTIADEWHEWHEPNPTEERFSEYFNRNPQHLELAAKSFANSQAYGNPHARIVTVTGTDEQARPTKGQYPLDMAFNFLSQPLRVLVENEISDGHFYITFLRVVDPDLAHLFTAVRPPIVFDQGGGNMEILNLIEHRVARASEHSMRPRLAVLADSDSRYPGHSPADTNRLVAACREHGIPVHVTKKRSQENYLPDAVFVEAAYIFSNLQTSVTFITSLSEAQRDHYPIKKGLAGGLSDAESSLYSSVLPVADGESPMKVTRIAEYFRERYSGELALNHLNERSCDTEFHVIAELLRKEL